MRSDSALFAVCKHYVITVQLQAKLQGKDTVNIGPAGWSRKFKNSGNNESTQFQSYNPLSKVATYNDAK